MRGLARPRIVVGKPDPGEPAPRPDQVALGDVFDGKAAEVLAHVWRRRAADDDPRKRADIGEERRLETAELAGVDHQDALHRGGDDGLLDRDLVKVGAARAAGPVHAAGGYEGLVDPEPSQIGQAVIRRK